VLRRREPPMLDWVAQRLGARLHPTHPQSRCRHPTGRVAWASLLGRSRQPVRSPGDSYGRSAAVRD
jgi:hypothetical protein